MKKRHVIAATAALITCNAGAYTVSLQNFVGADATAVPIIDNAGNAIASGGGFIAAGTYATAPTNAVEALELFSFGVVSNQLGAAFGGLDGFFTNSFVAPIPEGNTDPPVGERLYVVWANQPALNSATEVAVFDTGLVFGTENAVGQGGLDVIITDAVLTPANLLVGSIATDLDLGVGVTFSEGIQLAPIPEPSTSLLAALAGLGLVARRRR